MSSKMEMSLEDIITQTKGSRRGRGGGRGRGAGGGRGGRGGNRGGSPFKAGGNRRGGNNSRMWNPKSKGGSAADGVWSHDKYQDFGRRKTVGGGPQGGSAKITISNLHYGVSDADIMELFSEMGAIRYASVHYDRSGRSMGKADVTFERRADASQAIQQYNGVPLDGRPMAIGWASAPVAAQQTSPRTSNLRQVQGGRVVRPGGGRGGGFRGGRGGARGAGRGGRGGGQKKTAAPTAAELDAELDAYVSQKMV